MFAYDMCTVTHAWMYLIIGMPQLKLVVFLILRKENVLNSEPFFFQLKHLFKRFAPFTSIFFYVADSTNLF